MTEFLWHSGQGASISEAVHEFLAGEDVQLDRVLFPYDIKATEAHVRGLERIGMLSPADRDRLCDLLKDLSDEFASGQFVLDQRFEDGHSAIEIYLTGKAGDLGARVHTGRSRNDQVAVATRLYLLASLREVAQSCHASAQSCLHQAERHAMRPMPGYTHLQRAVPSSVGLWMGGFADAFADDLEFVLATRRLLDSNPLGTAAGYGVNLHLDREGVTADLGFARTQINPLAVQNSRGKFELAALHAASMALQDVRRLAWDLSLYTTAEFDFLELPEGFSTGSSIMPNKSNPDVVELLRGRVAVTFGAIVEIQSVLSLPSGYHRDLQLTKAPLIRGMQAAAQALSLVPALVSGLSYKFEHMRDAVTAGMFATDRAVEMTAAGLPFREAYRQAKDHPELRSHRQPEDSLKARVSPGGCGDLMLDRVRERLDQLICRF